MNSDDLWLNEDWINGKPRSTGLWVPVNAAQLTLKDWSHEEAVSCWDAIYSAFIDYEEYLKQLPGLRRRNPRGVEPWDRLDSWKADPVDLINQMQDHPVFKRLLTQYSEAELFSVIALYCASLHIAETADIRHNDNLTNSSHMTNADLCSHKAAQLALFSESKRWMKKGFDIEKRIELQKAIIEQNNKRKKGRKNSSKARKNNAEKWHAIYSKAAYEQWPKKPDWGVGRMAERLKDNVKDKDGNSTPHSARTIEDNNISLHMKKIALQ